MSPSFLLFLSIICCVSLAPGCAQGAAPLPNLSSNLLASPVVAGFSSGGAMATNLHIIFSSTFAGAAGFSSTFYYCNSGPRLTARSNCSNNKTTVATSTSQAATYEQQGLIDPLSNLQNGKVFFWSGTSDDVVPTAVSRKNVDFYKTYTATSNIRFTSQSAVHEFPTDDYGPVCPAPASGFVGNCSYAGSYEALSFLLGPSIQKPSGSVTTKPVVYFDQREFISGLPVAIGLDDSGFYYRPTGCEGDRKCQLLFFLHGCSLGNQQYLETFMDRIGLYKLAEQNSIVMIFPRANVNLLTNPQGCWDVFGYNNDDFATKNGAQVQVFKKILDRLYGQ